MKIDINCTVRRNPDILTAVIDDEIVMMSADQGQYFGLSNIGAHIWNMTEDPISVEELIAMLCQSYDVSAQTCKDDTLPFLNNMIDSGLMEVICR
ncbi:PqqD family peptide modification chaperone [Halomonas saccharevitans]|uniref:Coenzyme PQQ synthesis protein D (PqqD) n=1 Tax=Halomonas saccharevitans TaxID=416872 RepID=A0A1I7BE46_9GAMM|nr:PqqD family peptide modification chaperone [Halomonas saccharevitans]SFT85437.1 Coenzyme PQQ synthesis protein D (PqqD) [Halomonas saccharevitans]